MAESLWDLKEGVWYFVDYILTLVSTFSLNSSGGRRLPAAPFPEMGKNYIPGDGWITTLRSFALVYRVSCEALAGGTASNVPQPQQGKINRIRANSRLAVSHHALARSNVPAKIEPSSHPWQLLALGGDPPAPCTDAAGKCCMAGALSPWVLSRAGRTTLGMLFVVWCVEAPDIHHDV